MQNLKKWLEPIGLLLLLLAFGWQCIEERTSQMRTESYVLELNEKLIFIWDGVYDEAIHRNCYNGKSMGWVDYDSINKTIKDWGQIQRELSTINRQDSFFFRIRVVFYILGSVLVLLSKWPERR